MKYYFTLITLFVFNNITIAQTDSSAYLRRYLDSISPILQRQYDSINIKNENTIGTAYLPFSLPLNGQVYSNETLKGKVIFINFWFFSCSPCIAEMPVLNSLFEKYGKDKNFEFNSITFEKKEWIDNIKKKFGIKYHVYSIPKTECKRLMYDNGFPTNIIIDKNGMVRYLHAGGAINKKDIKVFFNNAIYRKISALLD